MEIMNNGAVNFSNEIERAFEDLSVRNCKRYFIGFEVLVDKTTNHYRVYGMFMTLNDMLKYADIDTKNAGLFKYESTTNRLRLKIKKGTMHELMKNKNAIVLYDEFKKFSKSGNNSGIKFEKMVKSYFGVSKEITTAKQGLDMTFVNEFNKKENIEIKFNGGTILENC